MTLVLLGAGVIMIAHASRARGAPPGISPFGTKCGEFNCGVADYCSEGRCEPCDLVCEPEHHNFDSQICIQECQNYLHDSMYVKKGAESIDGLKGRVEQLEKEFSTVIVICAVLLFLMLAFLLVCCFRNHRAYRSRLQKLILRTKKGSRQIPAALELTHQNPHTQSPVLARRARPIGVPVQDPPSLPTIPELIPQPQPQPLSPISPNTQEELRHFQSDEQIQNPAEGAPSQPPPISPRQQNQLPLNINGLQSIAESVPYHKPGQVTFIPVKNFPRLPGGAVMQVATSQLDTHSDLRSPSEDCLLSYGENERFARHPSPSPSETGHRAHNGVMAPIYGIHNNTPVHEGNTCAIQEPAVCRENDSDESIEVHCNLSGTSPTSSTEGKIGKDDTSFGSSSTMSLDSPQHIYSNPHQYSNSSENNDSHSRRKPVEQYYSNGAYHA